MGDGYDVSPEALRRYTNAVESAQGRLLQIRDRNIDLNLSDGVFGQLPEANSLRSDYHEQKQQSEEDLTDAAEALAEIAEAVRETAEGYDSTEESNWQTMEGQR
ncbi:DUF2563 family protein [Streptomyces sp. UC4497]